VAGTPAKAASTKPPAEKKAASKPIRADNAPLDTHPAAVAGPARTTEEIDAERRRVQPHVVSGPEAGNRLLLAPERDDETGAHLEQEEADLKSIVDTDPSTALVTVKDHVYEEVPAPGAPGRFIQRLLYRKGRVVKKSELDRALAAQRKSAKKADDSSS